LHNGSIGTKRERDDLEQPAVFDIDFEDLSMDWLPPENVPLLDCSTCDVYYADTNIATSSNENESLGGSSPLTTHECSTNNWGLNCCGYDYQTQQCGVQEFFPEFSFLHPCGGCADLELDSSGYPCTINQRNYCMDTDIISGKPSSNGTLTSAALVGIIASSSVVALILLIFGICKWKRSKAKHHNEIKMNNAQQQDHTNGDIVVATAVLDVEVIPYNDDNDNGKPSAPPLPLTHRELKPVGVQTSITKRSYVPASASKSSVPVKSPKFEKDCDVEVSITNDPEPELSFMQRLDIRELNDQKSMGFISEEQYREREYEILNSC